MSLTPQQELFCQRYVALKFNGSAAYRAAYPKVKSDATARANAARLLAKANVSDRVSQLTQKAAAAVKVTPEMVIQELGFIAMQRGSQIRRPDGSLKPPSEWDEATDATIAGMEVEEEFVPDDSEEPEQSKEPQPHGGALKRTAVKVKLVRTTKIKRWNKDQALKVLSEHFGLLKEAAPHPDRPKLDLTALTEEQRRVLRDFFRALRGV